MNSPAYLELLSQHIELGKIAEKHKNENARLQTELSNTIGYKYPTRTLLEFALKTQPEGDINLPKAKQDFFNQV
jgi:hypothetical protein